MEEQRLAAPHTGRTEKENWATKLRRLFLTPVYRGDKRFDNAFR